MNKLPGASPDNIADSAGQPWAGRDLSEHGERVHQFDHDDGLADPQLLRALETVRTSNDAASNELAVFQALKQARVFVPVVATSADSSGEDKESEMALVSIQAPDSRMTLPIFSSPVELAAWHALARPVPVWAPRAALAAAAENSQLLVLNPGAELAWVIRRPAVWALAQQRSWTPGYVHPEVHIIAAGIASQLPGIAGLQVRLGPGINTSTAEQVTVAGGGFGPEITLRVSWDENLDSQQRPLLLTQLQHGLASSSEFTDIVDSLTLETA